MEPGNTFESRVTSNEALSGSSKVGPINDICTMSTQSIRSNGPATAAESTRIKRFIAAREKEIQNLSNELEEEESHLTVCDDAIANLEIAVPEGKAALKIHQENLNALVGIRNRAESVDTSPSAEMKSESASREIYKKIRERVASPISRALPEIKSQIVALEDDIQSIKSAVREAVVELEGWKRQRSLSTKMLEHMKSIMAKEKESIRDARQAIRSLWMVPIEVWAMIFKLVINDAVDSFLSVSNPNPLRPDILKISQVCRVWRSMIDGAPQLWRLIAAPSHPRWVENELELLTSSLSKGEGPVTIIYNVSQAYKWNYQPQNRWNEHGSATLSSTSPDDVRLSSRPYNVHFHVAVDYGDLPQRLASTAFHKPSSIILSCQRPIVRSLFSSMGRRDEITSLTFRDYFPQSTSGTQIRTVFPSVAILSFQLKQFFTNFSLAEFLSPQLKELHLRHDDRALLPQLANNLTLQNLRTLGITYPAHNFFEKVRAYFLHRLILYGWNGGERKSIAQGSNAEHVYRGVVHLEFVDWRGRQDGDVFDVASALAALLEKMPKLQSVRFAGSFVEGENLVKLMKDWSGKLDHLETLTLSNVSGITRGECDQLATLVTQLNVYV